MKMKAAILIFFMTFAVDAAVFAQNFLLSPSELSCKKIYSDLDDALAHPDDVYVLCLSYCDLMEVPKEILNFKNLQRLSLDGNFI